MASQKHNEEQRHEVISEGILNAQGKMYSYIQEGILKTQALNSSELNLSSLHTILCSYPKSGTTWLKALAFSISTRACSDLTQLENHPLLSTSPHDLIPFLELDIAKRQQPLNPNVPLLSTHIPYKMLPRPILDSGCKFVYISRNPKDVLVSAYHFAQKIPNLVQRRVVPLELVFELFCTGTITPYGDYWDHVLGFQEESMAHQERALFLKYEDMMDGGDVHVRRLADFMGCPFSDREMLEGVPAMIGEMCSFGSLSKLEVNKSHELSTNQPGIGSSNSSYFRKGEVGDWRSYLTNEMSKKIDNITIQKLGNHLMCCVCEKEKYE